MSESPWAGLPPRIGLTTYRENAAWGVWNEAADLLPSSYADAVSVAGGVPLLLPPAGDRALEDHALEDHVLEDHALEDYASAAESALDGVHGLTLAGGADIDPSRYRAARDPRSGPARPNRDGWELQLVASALRRGMPILAICRGMQVLNVALGGDLIQHLPDVVGHDAHCPVLGRHGRHEVLLVDQSRVGGLLGERATVATYHHQGVDRLGSALVAVGWAEDGTVEAVEHESAGWVVGVQWHPEAYDGAALFRGFVLACAQHRDRTQRVGV